MNIVALVFLLLALLIVISAFFPNWDFARGPVVTVNRIVGLIIALVVLFIVYLIVEALFGGVVVHPAAASAVPLAAAGLFVVGSVSPTPEPSNGGPTSGGMSGYQVAYAAAWVVGIAGVVSGVLASIGYTGMRPSWETTDVSATAGIVSAICVGLAALLPQVTRSPATREARYLEAAAGVLPKDLRAKYPVSVLPPGPPPSPPAV